MGNGYICFVFNLKSRVADNNFIFKGNKSSLSGGVWEGGEVEGKRGVSGGLMPPSQPFILFSAPLDLRDTNLWP